MINRKYLVGLSIVLSMVLLMSAVAQTQPAAERTTASGLKIVDIPGPADGSVAKAGDTVWVHYTGKLADTGKEFDSSKGPGRGEPIDFVLGAGRVIKGWEEGIAGMKIGDKRQLTIPATLGYGASGTPGGPIPPNATLVFDVELMGLRRR